MIPYGKQTIDQKDIAAVLAALKSSHLTQGTRVPQFERALARYSGAKFAVASAHGTDALHLAYLAGGLRPGDEVITTPNTFAATANMLLAVGVKPVFCDIRLDTYNIDENKIEKLITKRTKAIVPVHFAGHPCEMEKIWQIAKRHKLLVIEDAAHALGGRYRGKKIGGGKSDMVVLSFHPVKSITTAEGGAVLTNNQRYAQIMQRLRTGGTIKNKHDFVVTTDLGYNYRLTELAAALGSSQLKKLDKFIAQRRQVARWYLEELRNLQHIILPTELPDARSAWHLFVIRVKSAPHRNLLMRFLRSRGIGTQLHYPALPSHPYYLRNGYGKTKLPHVKQYSATAISIPIFPTLTRSEVRFISKSVREYFA